MQRLIDHMEESLLPLLQEDLHTAERALSCAGHLKLHGELQHTSVPRFTPGRFFWHNSPNNTRHASQRCAPRRVSFWGVGS